MLHLIHTNRNHVCLVKKNVCCHQNRIGKKSGIDIICMLGSLILKLGHTIELTHIGKAVQNPCQFRMTRYMGLVINTILLGV